MNMSCPTTCGNFFQEGDPALDRMAQDWRRGWSTRLTATFDGAAKH